MILLLALLACGQPAHTEPTAPPAAVEPAPAAAPPTATPAQADPACYDACLRDSQARAVAWDQIERDCQAQCSGAKAPLQP